MWARSLAVVVLLTFSGSVSAQSTDNVRQTFRNVQRAVLGYQHFTVFDSIHAQIRDGVVILTGKVTLDFKRDEIERRVSKIRGVTRVDNQIEVLPASKFDNELRVGIADAIYRHPAFSNYATQVNPPIHIIVERGRVTLEGVVANQVDRALAYSIASSFQAFSVTNELRTEEEARRELEGL